MDFGIALATTTESWRAVKRAEALGFKYAWFYDTQLLNPDVFVGMALAARETKKIRLGTGVLIPSNRLSPVAANGLATLAKLAPGRIDFGVGTGFTGRRTMGQRAIKLAEFERYVAEVQGLLRGETVEALLEGEQQEDPLPESRARPDQPEEEDPAAHLRVRAERAKAGREARCGLGVLQRLDGARARRARRHAGDLEVRGPHREAVREPLYTRLCARAGRELHQQARARAGRPARGGALPRPGRARHARRDHGRAAAVPRPRRSSATRRSTSSTSRPTRAGSRCTAAT